MQPERFPIGDKFLIAIPFYGNESYIENFIAWFKSSASASDRELVSNVIVINDKPDSTEAVYLHQRCQSVGFELMANEVNIGYLRSANLAYQLAITSRDNLLLLNSDTIPEPGFLSELAECFAEDAMLGVLSARSNNATICNAFTEIINYHDSNYDVYKARLVDGLRQFMPRITYVPVVTGFCFAIKNKLLNNFSAFDEIFNPGYEEENDFCLRVSQKGYRIGIANHAFVTHLEGMSFSLTPTRNALRETNATILRRRFPYYDNLIRNYSESMDYKTFSRISAACMNERNLFIDARVLAPYHNGSNRFIKEFLQAVLDLGLSADILANPEAVAFHDLQGSETVQFIESVSCQYKFGFLLGQPMNESALWLVPCHSLISVCIFFDTIAHDCPQLRTENLMLDSIWSVMAYIYTDISFISNHSHKQFFLKFGSGRSRLHAHLLPVAVNKKLRISAASQGVAGLVFGNKFSHKGIAEFVEDTKDQSGIIFYLLGLPLPGAPQNYIFLDPGKISKEEIYDLFSRVEFFVMPSHAEGFGFPILEAIEWGKPIFCRNIPCYHEICAALKSESRLLVNIVDSFKSFNFKDLRHANAALLNREKETVKSYASYRAYLSAVLEDIQPSRDIFWFLKGQIIMRGSDSSRKYSLPLRFVREFYSCLLRSPLRSQVRWFKQWMQS
jgi:GT2 family glycosyltransferase